MSAVGSSSGAGGSAKENDSAPRGQVASPASTSSSESSRAPGSPANIARTDDSDKKAEAPSWKVGDGFVKSQDLKAEETDEGGAAGERLAMRMRAGFGLGSLHQREAKPHDAEASNSAKVEARKEAREAAAAEKARDLGRNGQDFLKVGEVGEAGKIAIERAKFRDAGPAEVGEAKKAARDAKPGEDRKDAEGSQKAGAEAKEPRTGEVGGLKAASESRTDGVGGSKEPSEAKDSRPDGKVQAAKPGAEAAGKPSQEMDWRLGDVLAGVKAGPEEKEAGSFDEATLAKRASEAKAARPAGEAAAVKAASDARESSAEKPEPREAAKPASEAAAVKPASEGREAAAVKSATEAREAAAPKPEARDAAAVKPVSDAREAAAVKDAAAAKPATEAKDSQAGAELAERKAPQAPEPRTAEAAKPAAEVKEAREAARAVPQAKETRPGSDAAAAKPEPEAMDWKLGEVLAKVKDEPEADTAQRTPEAKDSQGGAALAAAQAAPQAQAVRPVAEGASETVATEAIGSRRGQDAAAATEVAPATATPAAQATAPAAAGTPTGATSPADPSASPASGTPTGATPVPSGTPTSATATPDPAATPTGATATPAASTSTSTEAGAAPDAAAAATAAQADKSMWSALFSPESLKTAASVGMTALSVVNPVAGAAASLGAAAFSSEAFGSTMGSVWDGLRSGVSQVGDGFFQNAERRDVNLGDLNVKGMLQGEARRAESWFSQLSQRDQKWYQDYLSKVPEESRSRMTMLARRIDDRWVADLDQRERLRGAVMDGAQQQNLSELDLKLAQRVVLVDDDPTRRARALEAYGFGEEGQSRPGGPRSLVMVSGGEKGAEVTALTRPGSGRRGYGVSAEEARRRPAAYNSNNNTVFFSTDLLQGGNHQRAQNARNVVVGHELGHLQADRNLTVSEDYKKEHQLAFGLGLNSAYHRVTETPEIRAQKTEELTQIFQDYSLDNQDARGNAAHALENRDEYYASMASLWMAGKDRPEVRQAIRDFDPSTARLLHQVETDRLPSDREFLETSSFERLHRDYGLKREDLRAHQGWRNDDQRREGFERYLHEMAGASMAQYAAGTQLTHSGFGHGHGHGFTHGGFGGQHGGGNESMTASSTVGGVATASKVSGSSPAPARGIGYTPPSPSSSYTAAGPSSVSSSASPSFSSTSVSPSVSSTSVSGPSSSTGGYGGRVGYSPPVSGGGSGGWSNPSHGSGGGGGWQAGREELFRPVDPLAGLDKKRELDHAKDAKDAKEAKDAKGKDGGEAKDKAQQPQDVVDLSGVDLDHDGRIDLKEALQAKKGGVALSSDSWSALGKVLDRFGDLESRVRGPGVDGGRPARPAAEDVKQRPVGAEGAAAVGAPPPAATPRPVEPPLKVDTTPTGMFRDSYTALADVASGKGNDRSMQLLSALGREPGGGHAMADALEAMVAAPDGPKKVMDLFRAVGSKGEWAGHFGDAFTRVAKEAPERAIGTLLVATDHPRGIDSVSKLFRDMAVDPRGAVALGQTLDFGSRTVGGLRGTTELLQTLSRPVDENYGRATQLAQSLSESAAFVGGARGLGRTFGRLIEADGGGQTVANLLGRMTTEADGAIATGKLLTRVGFEREGAQDLGRALNRATGSREGARQVLGALDRITRTEGGSKQVAVLFDQLSRTNQGAKLLGNLAREGKGAEGLARIFERVQSSDPASATRLAKALDRLATEPRGQTDMDVFRGRAAASAPLAQAVGRLGLALPARTAGESGMNWGGPSSVPGPAPAPASALGAAGAGARGPAPASALGAAGAGARVTPATLAPEAAAAVFSVPSAPAGQVAGPTSPNQALATRAGGAVPAGVPVPAAPAAEPTRLQTQALGGAAFLMGMTPEALYQSMVHETPGAVSARGSAAVESAGGPAPASPVSRPEESAPVSRTREAASAAASNPLLSEEPTRAGNRNSAFFRPADVYSEQTLRHARICGECGFRLSPSGSCVRCAVQGYAEIRGAGRR